MSCTDINYKVEYLYRTPQVREVYTITVYKHSWFLYDLITHNQEVEEWFKSPIGKFSLKHSLGPLVISEFMGSYDTQCCMIQAKFEKNIYSEFLLRFGKI